MMDSNFSSRFVYLDIHQLRSLRSATKDVETGPADIVHQFQARADQTLGKAAPSVMDKTTVPPSGDKHDFYAIGAYSWPNPSTPDQLPYVRRDGMYNPEAYASEKYDKGRLQALVEDVKVLALAHLHTGNQVYAQKAAEFAEAWFVTPATRMNPNLRHAAVQPGVNDGRHSGVIEGVVLIDLLDHIELIHQTGGITDVQRDALKPWFLQFSDWLVHSEFGRSEIHSTNNHGTYYLAQVMAFASFAGHHERARSVIALAKRQIDRQFAPDGSIPREIERPNALFYSIYGLRGFVTLARLCERYGENLWHYRSPGRTAPAIARGFRFLAPYLSGAREWDGRRQDQVFSPYALQMCRVAARAYRARMINDMVAFLRNQPGAVGEFGILSRAEGPEATTDGDALFERMPSVEPRRLGDSVIVEKYRRVVSALARKGLIPSKALR